MAYQTFTKKWGFLRLAGHWFAKPAL